MRRKFSYKNISAYLILLLLCFACQNDDGIFSSQDDLASKVVEKFSISDGMIASPKWLASAVDSTAKSHVAGNSGKFIYPWVFSVNHDDVDYYMIMDPVKSTLSNTFYTLSGSIVPLGKGLDDELNLEENRTLLWRQGLETRETRALIYTVTVYTPNGSPVSDCWRTTEDYDFNQRNYKTTQTANTYPNATVLESATTTYNCHSFAWHISEGGEGNIWMGKTTNPTSAYWLDGSYVYATSSTGKKVSYNNDNHSAVTTNTPNVFRSKWGSLPLMEHPKNHSPYDYSSLSYHKRNDIPSFYIGSDAYDYDSQGSPIYTYGGNASFTLHAYSPHHSPTRYEWSAEFNGSCDRWYIWPSGSNADFSIYMGQNDSGGLFRINCKFYSGSTLIGNASYTISVY